MSGHSKWATIKHQKGAKDKARGKLFAKLIRQVEVSARNGGGDLDSNATLRTMYTKARAASVPLDTIEKAIKRGTGDLEGVIYESIMYEGYASGGVAILVEVLSDNRNRTGAEIRSIFSKGGGSMAEPGSVAWQFRRAGVITVPGTLSEDDLMMVAVEAGADDIELDDEVWRITCEPANMMAVKDALEAAKIPVESVDLAMLPDNLVPLDNVEDARKVLRVMDMLDDHDDVQEVFSNFDIPESILELVEA
jgi:YebC/PmpR family DNA-binding regulatory protein